MFRKTLEELEKMLCVERRTKFTSKGKAFKDEVFVDSFLELLFTGEEKVALSEGISENYNLPPPEEEVKEEEASGNIPHLSHLLKVCSK